MKIIRVKQLWFLLILLLPAVMLYGQEPMKKKVTVTFQTNMHCEACKAKMEKNLAFEKGVTNLDVNLEKNLVTIEYKAWQNDSTALKKAIEKLGYTARVVPHREVEETEKPGKHN